MLKDHGLSVLVWHRINLLFNFVCFIDSPHVSRWACTSLVLQSYVHLLLDSWYPFCPCSSAHWSLERPPFFDLHQRVFSFALNPSCQLHPRECLYLSKYFSARIIKRKKKRKRNIEKEKSKCFNELIVNYSLHVIFSCPWS